MAKKTTDQPVTRWPGAVLRPGVMMTKFVGTDHQVIREAREPCWVASPGRGSRRAYAFQPHRAAWRNFAETLRPTATPEMDGLTAYDHNRLQAFIRKYGPLYGQTFDDEYFGSVELACRLRTLAAVWDDDPDRSTTAPPAVEPATQQAGIWLQQTWETLQWVQGGSWPADRLDGRLMRGALAHLADSAVMRRCRTCHNWIELNPPTRQYCTGSCRALAAQRRAAED